MFSLFIPEMALKQDNKDIKTQEAQFRDIFLNLSKGQEDMKTLFAGNLTKERPDNNKDEQLEQLQAEVEAMRILMLGKMALIPILARGQEELRGIVNKLHQDGCNRMRQTVEAGDQVIHNSLMGKKVSLESGPFQMAVTPRV